ncbi:hypothetical protein BKA93DRAFT_709857, partial [Sparassis latifolia]
CAICLERHPHKVNACAAAVLWDQSLSTLAHCVDKLLMLRDGRPLCLDWQRPNSCPNHKHDQKHICSGCGENTHGAQDCPRAEK